DEWITHGCCDKPEAPGGAVRRSRIVSRNIASCRLPPHISSPGLSPTQTAGRSGFPKSRHLLSSVSCMHRTPAGFPPGIPGIGDEMDGAIQQAPQPDLHSIMLLR